MESSSVPQLSDYSPWPLGSPKMTMTLIVFFSLRPTLLFSNGSRTLTFGIGFEMVAVYRPRWYKAARKDSFIVH